MSTAVKSIGTTEAPSLSELRAQNAQFAVEVDKLHDKLQVAYASMSQFAGASQGTGSASARAGIDIEGLSSSMGKIAGRANAMLVVAGTAAAVGESLHTASAQAENLRTRLDLATGSKGAQEMAYVIALSDRLGLQLNTTGQAYADFATKARGTALEGAQVQTIFSGIASANAALGLSAEQSNASLAGMLALMGQGSIGAADFNEKLGHVPDAALISAQALGVTQERFTQMLETGEVVAQDFLPRFAQALQSSLGDGVDRAAGRLDAGTNRMGNAWDKLKVAIGDSGVSQVISVGMNAAANDMNAFSESMTRARDNGSGFLAQIGNGLGTLAGRAVGLNYISTGFQSNAEKASYLAKELPRARAELEALQARGAANSRNVWVRSAHDDAQRLVVKLQEAQRELMAVQGQRNAGGGRGFINPPLVRQAPSESKSSAAPASAPALKKETAAPRTASYVPQPPAPPPVDSERLKRDQEAEKRQQEVAQLLNEQKTKAELAEKNLELAQQETQAIGLTGEALGKLRQKQIEKAVADIEEKAAKEEGIRCSKELAEAVQREADATLKLAQIKDYNESARMVAEYTKSVKDANEAVQFEQSLATVSQRDRQIALEQYKIEIDLTKKLDDIAAKNQGDPKAAQRLKDETTKAALRSKAMVTERTRMQETQKAVEQMDEMFRKGFADTLENGTDAWRTFTKSLGASFKASVADQLYKAFVQPLVLPVIADVQGLIGSISGNFGIKDGVGVQGASGGTASLGGLSDWSTWGSKGSSWLINKGGSLASDGWQSTGSSLVSLGETVKSVDGWLKDIPGFGGGIGSAAGYLGSIYSLTQGQYGSSVGSAIGTYILPGIGTMVGSVLGGVLDTALGSRGANHSGGTYSTSTNDRNAAASLALGRDAWGNALGDITQRANTGIDKKLGETVNALSGVYKSLSQYASGGARDIDIAAAFAANGQYKDEDRYGYFQLLDKATGEVLKTYKNRELGKDDDAAWQKYVADLGVGIVQQLRDADIPKWMGEALETLGESPSIEKLTTAIAEINTAQAAMTQFGLAMPQFAAQADAARSALIEESGGSQALTGRLNSFYNNFFTETERTAVATGMLSDELAKLGYAMPTSRDEYRAWVTAAIESGEAGAKSAAGLLKLEGAVAGVTKASGEAADAQSAMSGLLDERRKLDAELLRAKGEETSHSAALRDMATEGYDAAARSAWDYNEAIREQIVSLDEAAQLQKALADVTGSAQKSTLDVLQQLMGRVSATSAFRSDLGASIESARLQTLTAGDQAGYLRSKERGLWVQLDTAQDPVAVAQQLQQTVLDRIGLEAKLRADIDASTLSGLQQQLSAVQSLRSAAEGMLRTVDGLRTGNTSALNPYTQLQYVAGKFDDAYARARAGDVSAWQDVQSFGQSYVQLGRDNYASSIGATDIFFKVTEAMDELASMGTGTAPEITALNTQIELLQSVGESTEQSKWTAQQQLESFQRLDEVMRQQQERQQTSADRQVELLQLQIAELRRANDLKDAEMGQRAAIETRQMALMERQATDLAALRESARMQEAVA